MSLKKENTYEPDAMSRDAFIAIFSSNAKGSRINDVIAEDTFVSAMSDILLRTLNSEDNVLPPYPDFNEGEYFNKLYDGLDYSDVEMLKGRIPNKKGKSEVYGFMANIYNTAVLQNIATSFMPDPNRSHYISSLNLNQGYTFASLVSDDEKIQSIIQKIDVLADLVLTNDPQNAPALIYKTVSTVLPMLANMNTASSYMDKEEQAIKEESVAEEEWLKRSFIAALRHKLTRRAKDKKTLYSMLKFAKNEKGKSTN